MFTGDRIPPDEAVALGLANFVVPDDRSGRRGNGLRAPSRGQPPQALQETKGVLNQSLRQAAVNALGYGLAAESQSHDTAEYVAVPEQMRAAQRRVTTGRDWARLAIPTRNSLPL